MTLQQLHYAMPMAELQAWADYAAIEPFGSHYDDLRAGAIAAATYNVNRDPKHRAEPFVPLDFTPWNSLATAASEPTVIGQDLTPDQLSALIDAQMFGKT